ncbi:MAG TPA: transglycosylase SLT domain-containing protein [Herbaspirillum sp.]|jgi:soluble lytic murein transglycosylase-like protein
MDSIRTDIDPVVKSDLFKNFFKKFCMTAILLGAAGLAQADCWEEAGREFSIAPELLYAIAEQESGLDPSVIGYNSNGSRDIGLMQINSSHLPRLAKQNITEKTLLANSCQSLKVGAGILADFMRRYGYSWKAVGAYNAGGAENSGAHQRRMAYAKKVAERYQRVMAKKNAAIEKRNAALRQAGRAAAIPALGTTLPPMKPDQPKRLNGLGRL